MQIRILIQPTIALLFAIRAGLRDARENKPPFLSTLIFGAINRRLLFKTMWKDVGKVFLCALIVDGIYQIIMFKIFFPLQAFCVAFVLAFFPYLIARGLVTRIANQIRKKRRKF